MGIKNYLNKLSKEELVAELCELESKFIIVHDYFLPKINSHGEKVLLVKYKEIIENEFFPKRGFGKARLSVARKAVTDFKKLHRTKESLSDIMLFYVEVGVSFTNEYGDIDEPFYESMENMYEDTAKYIYENNLWGDFEDRMKKIVSDTENCGWGFCDDLDYIYTEYRRKNKSG